MYYFWTNTAFRRAIFYFKDEKRHYALGLKDELDQPETVSRTVSQTMTHTVTHTALPSKSLDNIPEEETVQMKDIPKFSSVQESLIIH